MKVNVAKRAKYLLWDIKTAYRDYRRYRHTAKNVRNYFKCSFRESLAIAHMIDTWTSTHLLTLCKKEIQNGHCFGYLYYKGYVLYEDYSVYDGRIHTIELHDGFFWSDIFRGYKRLQAVFSLFHLEEYLKDRLYCVRDYNVNGRYW